MEIVTERACSKCGVVKPRTTEFFHKCSSRPDGLRAYCKVCGCAAARIAARSVSPEVKARRNESKRLDPIQKEKSRLRTREWAKNNKEKKKAMDAEYYKRRPEVNKAASERYRARHPERVKQAARRSAQRNAVAKRTHCRNYRARKRAAEGKHNKQDILLKLAQQNGLCYWCQKSLGEVYEVDHIIPLSRGGANGPGNLCCTCVSCNRSKSAKLPHEFSNRLF